MRSREPYSIEAFLKPPLHTKSPVYQEYSHRRLSFCSGTVPGSGWRCWHVPAESFQTTLRLPPGFGCVQIQLTKRMKTKPIRHDQWPDIQYARRLPAKRTVTPHWAWSALWSLNYTFFQLPWWIHWEGYSAMHTSDVPGLRYNICEVWEKACNSILSTHL